MELEAARRAFTQLGAGPDLTRVELRGAISNLTVDTGKRFSLDRGSLRSSVAKQKGAPMVIDTPPFRSPLTQLQRVGFLLGAMVVSWVLALVLVFSAVPIYSYYAAVVTTPHLVAGTLVFTDPGGLTALADQELAGGIMWVPGSIPFSVGIFVFLYRWLDDGHPAVRAREEADPGLPGRSSHFGGV